jgi:hypothetical protein
VCSQRDDYQHIPITTVDGEPYTWLGSPSPDNPYLDDDLCPREAAIDIGRAYYLALIGQHYNNDTTLWAAPDSVR